MFGARLFDVESLPFEPRPFAPVVEVVSVLPFADFSPRILPPLVAISVSSTRSTLTFVSAPFLSMNEAVSNDRSPRLTSSFFSPAFSETGSEFPSFNVTVVPTTFTSTCGSRISTRSVPFGV